MLQSDSLTAVLLLKLVHADELNSLTAVLLLKLVHAGTLFKLYSSLNPPSLTAGEAAVLVVAGGWWELLLLLALTTGATASARWRTLLGTAGLGFLKVHADVTCCCAPGTKAGGELFHSPLSIEPTIAFTLPAWGGRAAGPAAGGTAVEDRAAAMAAVILVSIEALPYHGGWAESCCFDWGCCLLLLAC